MRNQMIILLGFIVVMFCTCDRWTPVSSEIRNLSSDTLILIARLDSVQIKVLAPNAVITDFKSQYTGKLPKRNFKCCPCEFSYLEVYPKNPAKRLLKEIMIKENWDLDKSDLKEDRIMRCSFTVNSTDIQ